MTSNISPRIPRAPLGWDFQETCEAAERLWLLDQLSQNLPFGGLKKLQRVLQSALETPEFNWKIFKDGLKSIREKLPRIVLQELSSEKPIDTKEKIRDLLVKLQFLTTSPFVNAKHATQGPTLIGNYCLGSIDNPAACVIKYSNREEHAANRMYRFLGIRVPVSSHFNFNNRSFETTDGKRTFLSPRDARRLEQTFSAISSRYVQTDDQKRSYQNRYLMLAERIPGENLFDFVFSGKYKALNALQKADLFKEFGRIAMADFIMGHFDRFVSVDPEATHYELDRGVGANFGNVMIYWNPEKPRSPLVFAVDNEPSPKLEGEKHLSFLQKSFLSKDWIQDLAKSIMVAFKSPQFDELPGNIGSMQETWENSIAEDLKKDTQLFDSFQEGLQEMLRRLREKHISRWEKAELLKKTLSEISPSFLKDVAERIECVKDVERS